MTKVDAKILRDWQFYLCVSLGPLGWLLLTLYLPLREDWTLSSITGLTLFLSVALYPILEEVVFRGLIQDWLTNLTKRRHYGLLSAANLLTSGLFVLAHLIYQPWQWALLVIFPSLIFGYMKERHSSLRSPILLHSFYNLGFVLIFV